MRTSQKTWLRWLSSFVVLATYCLEIQAATTTRVILDRSTFPAISRPLLQETADQVTQVVDQLIPGKYPAGRKPKILCFVAKGKWGNQPRALVGRPWKIEPPTAKEYDMRVAVTPEVLPGAWQRLVFQLAHELTHQKMDARVDNNAMEAFAVAVSLEVLHRLEYDSYRKANENYYAQTLPPEVLSAFKQGKWDLVALYLRYQWRHEYVLEDWDRAPQFLAAMTLRKINGFPWARLLNIGGSAQCGSKRVEGRAQYCPFSPASLEGFPEEIKNLIGNDTVRGVIVGAGARRPEGGALTFRENGKWVSLRWSRKSDPVIPDGFAPLD